MRTHVVAFLIALSLASAAEAKPEGRGLDTITVSGKPGDLAAKFEGRHLRVDVREGERVVFKIEEQVLEGTVDDDGVARAEVTRVEEGVYEFVASLKLRSRRVRRPGPRRNGRWRRIPGETVLAKGRLWVLSPSRPLAVVDIDGTISDMKDWKVPFRGHKAKTYPGAPELLRKLAQTHTVVYLTARDDALDNKTRKFLRRHDFPAGPIIYNDLGLQTSDELRQLNPDRHAAFKLAKIRALQAMGLQVAVGIGNAETDGLAYEAAGVPSFLNTTKAGGGKSVRFTRYSDLKAHLVRANILTADRAGMASKLP